MSKLATILGQIDSGTMLLPEFQRGYVWNRDQVRGLMRSLYLDYPVGSLLLWDTATDPGAVRGSAPTGDGNKLLLLDGQQRITSLYGIMRGRAPDFFEGNEAAFTGLRFNVEHEVFEFYAPAKMKGDPLWVDVTTVFSTNGLVEASQVLSTHPATAANVVTYITRLARLLELQNREFHEERISGPDKGFDVVVDIFNRVNSGGTKLSKGDLALAKLCAHWPGARAAMRGHLATWKGSGYDFSLDWLLRNVNAVATGRASFSALEAVSPSAFQSALSDTGGHVGQVLDTIRGRLGLDHDRVLMGRFGIPVMAYHLHRQGGAFADAGETDRWLYWYIHTGLWGRYAGSTESVLARDYETLAKGGLDALLTEVERSRGGNLDLGSHDFAGSTMGSRFYPMLYLLTRVLQARDFCSGLALNSQMLGHLGRLQVHHLFPKARLRDAGYNRAEINAVANYAFLTQSCNLSIGARRPEEYFAQVADRQPGALESQWIPMDPQLWQVERYPDFLEARRELLATAANTFLQGLLGGDTSQARQTLGAITVSDLDGDVGVGFASSLLEAMSELGCAAPEFDVQIDDPDTGVAVAVAEAFWPQGLQPGQGDPVVLEVDPQQGAIERLQALGYLVFTTTESLLTFAHRRNAEASGETDPGEQVALLPDAEPIRPD